MPGTAPCLLSRENRAAIFKCPPPAAPSRPPSSCSPGTAELVGHRNPTSLCRANTTPVFLGCCWGPRRPVPPAALLDPIWGVLWGGSEAPHSWG